MLQGLTKDEVKDRLVAEFGDEVLAVPEAEGFDLAAWLVPGVAVVVAGVGIVIGLRRWRRVGTEAHPEGRPDGPAGEEARRLEDDLARYDL